MTTYEIQFRRDGGGYWYEITTSDGRFVTAAWIPGRRCRAESEGFARLERWQRIAMMVA